MTDRTSLITRLAAATARADDSMPLTWRLCHATRDLLAVDGASLTLQNSTPDRITLCATDARASELENLQDVLAEGPCRDAFSLGRIVETTLLPQAAERWPRFIPAASEVVGGQAVLWSVPMRAGRDVIGAVSLYSSHRTRLAEPSDSVQFLADALAVTVLHDPAATEEPSDPRDWGSRSQVHQATGMLVGQLGLAPDDALALLRASAFAAGRPLVDVARDVIERRVDLSDR